MEKMGITSQWLERRPSNPTVVRSSPGRGEGWVRMRRIVARSVDRTIFLDVFFHFGVSHLTSYILSFFL